MHETPLKNGRFPPAKTGDIARFTPETVANFPVLFRKKNAFFHNTCKSFASVYEPVTSFENNTS
jgi:hypothetical protein